MNHSHVLYDSDPHFNIDPISRNIVNASSKKIRLIQYDHNSERFTFEIPRYVEGHDMSMCNLVEIHYAVQEANTKIVRGGVYTVDDLQAYSENDDVVVCSWLIPHNVTQYVGQLQFLIRFACVNDDTGKLDYVWNTGIHNGITISSGIYNNESQSDNQAPPFNFITMVSGEILKFSVVDQLVYDELKDGGNLLPNCMYFITDEQEVEDNDAVVDELTSKVDGLADRVDDLVGELISGDFTVADSEHANRADHAKNYTRVYLVNVTFETTGSVYFHWYTNNDLTENWESLFTDVILRIGVAGSEVNQRRATLPCYGFIPKFSLSEDSSFPAETITFSRYSDNSTATYTYYLEIIGCDTGEAFSRLVMISDVTSFKITKLV